jgi:hypothetical protein
MRKLLLMMFTLAALTCAAWPQQPKADDLKQEAAREVDSMSVLTQQMVDQIFSYAELGFQEYETSRYLTGILKEHGFQIENGVAGIPTAWVASWGSGLPISTAFRGLRRNQESRITIPSSRARPGTVRDTTRVKPSTSPPLLRCRS